MSPSPRTTTWIAISALIIALVAAGLGVLVLIRGSKPGDTLVLRDPSGRERIRLLAQDSGGSIELVDESGQSRASLRQDGDKMMLELFPKSATDHAVVLESLRGGGLLELDDKSSHSIVQLGADKGGGFSVTTPVGGASLVISPSISSELSLYFGNQRGDFELSEHLAALTINGKNVAPTSP